MINMWTADGDCVGSQAAHRGSVNFLSDINCNLNYRGFLGAPMMFSLGSDNVIKLWDLKRFKSSAEIAMPTNVTKGVWAGESIITSGPTGAVTCWNYANTRVVDAGAGPSLSVSRDACPANAWTGKSLTCHSAACTDLISTESFVASSAKNGQVGSFFPYNFKTQPEP